MNNKQIIAFFIGLIAAGVGGFFFFTYDESTSTPSIVMSDGMENELGKRANLIKASLAHLHQVRRTPKEGDWLAEHHEDGQTFLQYLSCNPTLPTETRNTIYIQQLGEFDKTEKSILILTADYLHRFYGLPVELLDPIPISDVPEEAFRIHEMTEQQQMHAGIILDDVLAPNLPEDAAACIAFTSIDLYPRESWNFVFGMANIKKRVGVWSLNRYGDPRESQASFNLVLKRALKTASHETGHMFTIKHCIFYECNMSGSNHIVEADAKPHYLCPECLPKISYAMGIDEVYRLGKIKEFWEHLGDTAMTDFYDQSIQALQQLN